MLRVLRTGLAFVVFGIGSVIVAGAVLPLLPLIGGTHDRCQRRAQYLIHLSFRLFTWFMQFLGLITVSIVGQERLRRGPPAVVIANHPTLIDVVLLVSAMPQVDCVVKQGAWRNPFLRGIVAGAGYLRNTGGPQLVDACVERLRAGRWLLLFPEGTRSPRRGLGSFRRGVAHVAQRAGVDIVPVVITCDPPTLAKGEPWYRVPPRTARLTVSVGERLRLRAVGPGDNAVRAARQWTTQIRHLYAMSLGHGDD
jgi:1-acyl-sn-glycerol-3-phosphate acyltransferase